MGFVKTIIIKTLSVRGISKIGSTNNFFVKIIWTLFVLSMSSLLTYATVKLVQEFLAYDLVIQVSIKSNDHSTEFPTFSFCHHHPFSPQAKQFWDSKTILSPSDFNDNIRKTMKKFLTTDKFFAYNLFQQDKKRVYYQHLSYSDADEIGWSINDTFVVCSIQQGDYMETSEGVSCKMTVKKISIPQYFNCFSVTPQDYDPQSRVTSLTLLIRVSPGINESLEHQKGFICGIFDQLSGLRAMVHEIGTYPDIENEGFNIEPGKLVEINYEVIRNRKLSTPKRPCFNEKRDQLIDLNNSFNFSQQACFKSLRGLSSLRACSCYFADTLRDGIPNNTHPYCGNVLNLTSDQLNKRVQCLMKWSKEFKTSTEKVFRNECKPSCKYYYYFLSLSVTRWLPTNWQLGWLLDIDSAFLSYFSSPTEEESVTKRRKIETYLNSSDLTFHSRMKKLVDHDNFVMVVIRRKGFDTTEKKDKLTLDLYNLVSRFGGLCSLCLGLTCAFVMEVVEIIYLTIQENKKQNKKQNAPPETEKLSKDCDSVTPLQRTESPVWLSSL